jgi:hypothetical protein
MVVAGPWPGTTLDGVNDLLTVAAGEVGAADAAGEERVTSEDHLERSEVKTDGTLRVAGGVKDLGRIVFKADGTAVVEGFVGWGGFRGIDTNPVCLFSHDLELGKVVFVEKDGGAGELFKPLRTADVIDMRVGYKDLLEGEAEGGEAAMDAGDLIARVDDDGFAGFLVGQDCAVALERADGKGLENHGFIVGLEGVRQMKRQTRLGLPFASRGKSAICLASPELRMRALRHRAPSARVRNERRGR